MNVLKTENGLRPAEGEHVKCRINKRTYKFCLPHNISVLNVNKFENITTKFAIEIEDLIAPPEIEAVVDGKEVRWQASPAADVLRYRVYASQAGTPFDIDEYISIERDSYKEMFKNSEQIFVYVSPVDLTNFNVKVVAEDMSGNYIRP